MKQLLLIVKNVRRHPLRTLLTSLGTMVLVCVVTLVWSVLAFLDAMSVQKSSDFKAIVTERWRIPSLMPMTYAASLEKGAARRPGDERPMDSMLWQFYVGTLDQGPATRENTLFTVATDPRKIRTMMDELEDLPPEEAAPLDAAVAKMLANRRAIIIGQDRLNSMNKRIGERFTIYSQMYRGINLEFEIVGVFPPGRWDGTAVMNAEYLNEAIDAYGKKPGNPVHPHGQQAAEFGVAAAAELGLVSTDLAADRRLAGILQSGGEVRNALLVGDHGVRGAAGHHLGSSLAAGPGGPGDALPGDRQLDQHQRPRAAHGIGGAEGAGLSPPADSRPGPRRGPVGGDRFRTRQRDPHVRADQRRDPGDQVSLGLLRFVLHSRQRILVGHGDGRGDRLAGQRRSRLDRETSKWRKSSPKWRE